jgi:hypothetical protein
VRCCWCTLRRVLAGVDADHRLVIEIGDEDIYRDGESERSYDSEWRMLLWTGSLSSNGTASQCAVLSLLAL